MCVYVCVCVCVCVYVSLSIGMWHLEGATELKQVSNEIHNIYCALTCYEILLLCNI